MPELILNQTAFAIAEGAIRVKYNGQRAFACVIVDQDGGTNSSPLIKLGVSDTTLAAAVTAAETVFTSTANTDRLDHIVAAIRWWKTTTSGARVETGDFECEILHAVGNALIDTPYHASAPKFEDDDGSTTNYADGSWHDTMLWDNDSAGVYGVHLRLPHPSLSKGHIAIDSIVGDLTETDGTIVNAGGMIRIIYDNDGNTLWSSGAQTTLGLANFNIIAGARSGVRRWNAPVIIYDRAYTAGDYANCGATTAVAMWGIDL